MAPQTPLGVQRDVLETRKLAGVSGAEYGTSPGHGRNILRILKTCQSLGSLKATSKGNHDGFPTSPRKAMLGLNPVISGHFQSV